MTRAASKPLISPPAKERLAVHRLRAVNQARQAKAAAAARPRALIIEEELAKPRAPECACQITPAITNAQLTALGAGFSAGRWVCPTLDAIRRRLRA